MNWEMKSLSHVATISSGQSAPQNESDFSNTGIPFVRAGHLLELSLGMPEDSLMRVTDETVSNYKLKLFPAGTVLFAKSGMSCMKGIVYQLKNDACVVNHLACIIPKKVDGRYLAYLFTVNRPNRLIRGEVYPSIRISDIAKMRIPLPPLNIQRQIASALDKARILIAARREQIAVLDKLAKDLFINMFGDPVTNPQKWRFEKLEKYTIFLTSGLNFDAIKSLQFLLPPFEMQQDFENKKLEIISQKTRLMASLAELETLYKSLAARAFSGELFG